MPFCLRALLTGAFLSYDEEGSFTLKPHVSEHELFDVVESLLVSCAQPLRKLGVRAVIQKTNLPGSEPQDVVVLQDMSSDLDAYVSVDPFNVVTLCTKPKGVDISEMFKPFSAQPQTPTPCSMNAGVGDMPPCAPSPCFPISISKESKDSTHTHMHGKTQSNCVHEFSAFDTLMTLAGAGYNLPLTPPHACVAAQYSRPQTVIIDGQVVKLSDIISINKKVACIGSTKGKIACAAAKTGKSLVGTTNLERRKKHADALERRLKSASPPRKNKLHRSLTMSKSRSSAQMDRLLTDVVRSMGVGRT